MSIPTFGELLKDLDEITPMWSPDGKKLKLSLEQVEQLTRVAQACQESGDALEQGMKVVGKLMAASASSELPMSGNEIEHLGWFVQEVLDVVHCLKDVGLGAEYRLRVMGQGVPV